MSNNFAPLDESNTARPRGSAFLEFEDVEQTSIWFDALQAAAAIGDIQEDCLDAFAPSSPSSVSSPEPLDSVLPIPPLSSEIHVVNNKNDDNDKNKNDDARQRTDGDVGQQENRTKARHVKVRASTQQRVQFSAGTLNACITCFLVGLGISYPLPLCVLYGIKVMIFFPYRWWTWRQEKMHYFLCDFCYFANMLVVTLLVGYWTSWIKFELVSHAFLGLWVLTHGPLAFAVVLFNNKVLFHSIQHVISLMIHLTPAAIFWTLRWSQRETPGSLGHHSDQLCNNDPFYVILAKMLSFAAPAYAVWLVVYYFIVCVVRAKKLDSGGYQTLFTDVMGPESRSPVKRFLLRLFPSSITLQKIAFLSTHLIFSFVTGSAASLLFCSLPAHSLFVLAVATASVWNASNFYMRLLIRK